MSVCTCSCVSVRCNPTPSTVIGKVNLHLFQPEPHQGVKNTLRRRNIILSVISKHKKKYISNKFQINAFWKNNNNIYSFRYINYFPKLLKYVVLLVKAVNRDVVIVCHKLATPDLLFYLLCQPKAHPNAACHTSICYNPRQKRSCILFTLTIKNSQKDKRTITVTVPVNGIKRLGQM